MQFYNSFVVTLSSQNFLSFCICPKQNYCFPAIEAEGREMCHFYDDTIIQNHSEEIIWSVFLFCFYIS